MDTIAVMPKTEDDFSGRIHALFSQLDEYTKGQPLTELTPESAETIITGISYVTKTQKSLRKEPDKLLVSLESNLHWLMNMMQAKSISKISR